MSTTYEDQHPLKALLNRQTLERKVGAFQSVFQRTDQIFTGSADVTLRLVTPGVDAEFSMVPSSVPAWNNGQTIFMNREEIAAAFTKAISTDTLSAFKGLNYHEVGHIIYTPRIGEPICRKLIEEENRRSGILGVWNGMEDQRMESMFVAMYRSLGPLFTVTVIRWITGGYQPNPAEQYALLYGRKFLPLDLRMSFRLKAVQEYGPDQVRELEAILDEYVLVSFPKDTNKALALVIKMYEWLNKNHPTTQLPCSCGINNSKTRQATQTNVMRHGRAAASEQKEAAEWLQDMMDDEADDAEQQKDAQEGKAQNGKGGTESDTQGTAEGEGELAPDGHGIGDGQSERGNGVKSSPDDPWEKAREIYEETMKDESITTDQRETLRAIKELVKKGQVHAEGDEEAYELTGASSSDVALSRSVVREFKALRVDLEPHWVRGEATGKIDPRRVMRRAIDPSLVNVFNRWEEGEEDEATAEVVLLVDVSLSMAGVMSRVSEILWVLKHAFDQLDIPCTVIAFSSGYGIMYNADERAENTQVRYFRAGGGTDISGALVETFRIMSVSQQTHKLVIAITDGGWSEYSVDQSKNIIDSLKRDYNCVTMIYHIGGRYDSTLQRRFDRHTTVGLPEEVQKSVKETLKQLAKRH